MARAFGFPEDEISTITKYLPHYGVNQLMQAIETIPECRDLQKNAAAFSQVLNIAQRIADFPRHQSIHPGGVLIAPDKINYYTPLQVAGKGIVVSHYDMYSTEPLGLVKMDLLGVRSLSIITDCLKSIRQLHLQQKNSGAPNLNSEKSADQIPAGEIPYQPVSAQPSSGMIQKNQRCENIWQLTCLIIDDEADQASLNTKTSRLDGTRSAINDRISELRGFFEKNTYLQVTATPQALFLQTPGHDFRPKFTVLSQPGADYVGGEDFFGDNSRLVREFDLNDIAILAPGPQPAPGLQTPRSLVRALDTFMIGATFKRMRDPQENCAFLCHVSTRTDDHKHIVNLLWKYKDDLAAGVAARTPARC